MLSLLAAVTLAATPASAPPVLTPPQSMALRCGVVFALGTRMQADRKPAAAGWPPLEARGKEYFVRMLARLIDDTRASRDTLSAMAAREAASYRDDAAVAAALPGCLPLLDAAGL